MQSMSGAFKFSKDSIAILPLSWVCDYPAVSHLSQVPFFGILAILLWNRNDYSLIKLSWKGVRSPYRSAGTARAEMNNSTERSWSPVAFIGLGDLKFEMIFPPFRKAVLFCMTWWLAISSTRGRTWLDIIRLKTSPAARHCGWRVHG